MVAAVVVALVAAHSMYNKPHRDYASEEVLVLVFCRLAEWHTSHPSRITPNGRIKWSK